MTASDEQPQEIEATAEETPAQRPRRKWRKRLLVTLAVLVTVLGIAAASVGVYVSSVPVPEALNLPESTVVYYADGKTEMARLGTQNRTIVDMAQLPVYVGWAVMSAEDRSFETNPGIDVGGALRAAVGGGSSDGASTITMQYARMAADLADGSGSARTAAMAWKLDDQYSKQEILGFYVNGVYFGRAAYGIDAAAYAYFNKPAKELTLPEAMVLAGVIKSPGNSAFDPAVHPQEAQERWRYIRDGLITMGKISAADADKLTYPTTFVKWSPNKPAAGSGLDKPTGLVVQHALSELRQTAEFKDKPKGYVENGGFRIVTTIDKAAEDAAIALADETATTSPLHGQPKNLQAALVAVQPGTGRVLAYFGGHNGAGTDYAGWYYDADDTPTGYGAHRPGATFHAYDLAAALKEGISLKSYWDSRSPKTFPKSGRGANNPVRNSSSAGCNACTLLQATTASLTTPFFGLTEQIGPDKVIDMARAAGVNDMWASVKDGDKVKLQRVDLRTAQGASVAKQFGTEVGIGQYPVTVLDQANGMATFGASGVRAEAHFVAKVLKADKVVYAEKLPTGTEPIINENAANDLAYALSRAEVGKLPDGQRTAAITGTWHLDGSQVENAHAWTIGYSKNLAVAVWTGNKAKEQALRLADGQRVYGATLAGPIYRDFMVQVTKALALKPQPFGSPVFMGDPKAGNTPSPGR